MTDTQHTASNGNCCAHTDGRNVVNICSADNILYIGGGCRPQPGNTGSGDTPPPGPLGTPIMTGHGLTYAGLSSDDQHRIWASGYGEDKEQLVARYDADFNSVTLLTAEHAEYQSLLHICQDDEGFHYAAGAQVDPLTHIPTGHLIKLDADMNVLAQVQLLPEISAQIDGLEFSNGHLYIAGDYRGNFSNASGTLTRSYIAKLTTDLSLVDYRIISSGGDSIHGRAMTSSPAGDLYYTANVLSAAHKNAVVIVRFDENLAMQNYQMLDDTDTIIGCTVGAGGRLYCCGGSSATENLLYSFSADLSDMRVESCTASGRKLACYNLQADSDGNLYVMGLIYDADGINRHAMVMKTDANLVLLDSWHLQHPDHSGSELYGSTLTDDGTPFLAGRLSGSRGLLFNADFLAEPAQGWQVNLVPELAITADHTVPTINSLPLTTDNSSPLSLTTTAVTYLQTQVAIPHD